MKKMLSIRGQGLTEVALVIGIVGLMLISMQVYVKRGVQGKLKALTDKMISSDQEAYQQDVSGLEINESKSEVTISAKMEAAEAVGGVKSLTSVKPEITKQVSISKSEDK